MLLKGRKSHAGKNGQLHIHSNCVADLDQEVTTHTHTPQRSRPRPAGWTLEERTGSFSMQSMVAMANGEFSDATSRMIEYSLAGASGKVVR